MNPSTLVVSNFKTGFETDREPFLINNDAFPILENAYLFRGRVRKKRGTRLLGRLQRDFEDVSLGDWDSGTSVYNVKSLIPISGETNSQFIPGFVITLAAPASQTLTDNGTGVFVVSPITATNIQSATFNYLTGVVTVVWGGVTAASAATLTGSYWPTLPVMGLEDHLVGRTNFPDLVAFDTKYAYEFNQTSRLFYDVSFYKMTKLPVVWSGADYQQFWSTNYQGAMWVTNNKPGFQFTTISAITDQMSTTITMTLGSMDLEEGTTLWFNEVVAAVATINGASGIITDNAAAPDYEVTFLTTQTVTTYASGGIAQSLTQSLSGTQDGIRWYDGDPTAAAPPDNKGFVNFAPPLQSGLTPQYLVGAKAIVPFKDHLLFFGTWTQTSTGQAIFNRNQVVYSQNGTAYYSLPVPDNQTFQVEAYYRNVAGRGGFINAPVPEEIITVESNDDVLIVGLENKQMKLIFTGDDSLPFIFQTINSEMGNQSTFAAISLDIGVMGVGPFGITLTTQQSTQRTDVVIPDQIFDFSPRDNGDSRVCAARDYRNEFIYFTYCPQNNTAKFPSRTLLYNYRESNWAILTENYTHYGQFRFFSGFTWATLPFRTWSAWSFPWNYGGSGERFADVIGGNQHGFVMIKDQGTTEANSQYISSVTGTLIGSPAHGLNDGDFIEISGVIADGGSMAATLNGQIFRIAVNQATPDVFTILTVLPITGTYLGGGVYRRLTNLYVQTKQFPIFWEGARQTRIGAQRFLLDTTRNGEITVDLYTDQNPDTPVNDPAISDYLPYSNVVLTRPEPGQAYRAGQTQIWHRMSNSFNGDSVQIGFRLSDTQMQDNAVNSSEVTIQAIVMDLYPGPVIA